MKNNNDISLYVGIASYAIGIFIIVAFLFIITTSFIITTVIGSIITSMFLCAMGEALITDNKNKKKKEIKQHENQDLQRNRRGQQP